VSVIASRCAPAAVYEWHGRYPRIVSSVLALRVDSIVLDGEVAWITEDGDTGFEVLHSGSVDEWAPLLAARGMQPRWAAFGGADLPFQQFDQVRSRVMLLSLVAPFTVRD
jgi:hypothetical protein